MKVVLYLAVMVGWVVFDWMEYNGNDLQFFYFSAQSLPFKTWLYFVMEHAGIIAILISSYEEPDKYKLSTGVFIVLQILDLADFMLTYNEPWFGISWLTFNLVSMVVMVIVGSYDLNISARKT